MSTSDAYSYEGLEDAPVIPEDQREDSADDIGDEADQNVRAVDALLRSMLKEKVETDLAVPGLFKKKTI